jgi:NADPH:quinone reductase-like Zn-dependent oxidoreductase
VAPDGHSLAVVARLLESAAVRVHVDRIFELDQVAEAHRSLELGHTRGKLVLKVAEG